MEEYEINEILDMLNSDMSIEEIIKEIERRKEFEKKRKINNVRPE